MMLYSKVRAVERLFNDLDREIATFKKASELNCLTGCSMCCAKPDIHASVLEFLPFAYKLFKEGQAEAFLKNAESSRTRFTCYNLSDTAGSLWGCTTYAHRGLICRLFGFSAMINRQGRPELVTCNNIKTALHDSYTRATGNIENGMAVPIMRDYYYRLRFIDPDLGTGLLPINTAITEAVKVVLGYYAYRRPRKSA